MEIQRSGGGRLKRLVQIDPDVVRHALWVSVWGRWLVWLVGVVMLVRSPGLWHPQHSGYLYLNVSLTVVNVFVHLRLVARRPMTWGWLMGLSTVDVVMITASVMVSISATGALDHFMFITYYPALAVFAAVFSSLLLVLAWTTATAVVYTAVAVTAVSGLSIEEVQQHMLAGRLLVMFLVAVGVSLVVRFERARTLAATARERRAHQEHIDLSQQIHDTTAQTAYMIGLGIEGAIKLAGDSNPNLTQRLEATASLSRSAMWELRRPIDMVRIVEGRELIGVLGAHTATFARISSVNAEIVHTGEEPPLPQQVRAGLFSIAHNALANALLHARASSVEVRLDFEPDATHLRVADDGIGLPEDYAGSGRGFRGMSVEAHKIGGRLVVESGGLGDGTSITCIVPRSPAATKD